MTSEITMWLRRCLWMLGLSICLPAMLSAQVIILPPHPPRPIPIPTPRPVPTSYNIRQVETHVTVKDQAAQVQVSQYFKNTGSSTLEASFFFPLPESAAVSGLTLMVDGKELPGKLLGKEDARKIYEEIVRRQRDPALLEYMGQGLFQTSVFPIPAGAERKVDIRYSQLLRKDSGLIDLVLPLGTNKHSNKPIESLSVTVRVEATDSIKTVYSPTHKIDIDRPDDHHAVCKLSLQNVSSPDDFRLMYGTNSGMVGMSLLSYRPMESEDGYFLLLASPEVKSEKTERLDKTIVFVVDRSGSMSGKKIEQARESLKFVLRQLQPTDTFNIVAYDSAVETFREELQRADEATIKAALGFVDGLFAGGSTNIDGALQSALHMLKDKARPNYVLFLTDGLPTVGEMNELNIAKNVKEANKVDARVFSFGVGFDVNSRLLDRLSSEQRGQSLYVKPNEDIEAQVASLYNKIGSPLLTNLELNFEFDEKQPAEAPAPISRTYPKVLTDLFQGEQLVYVGRYRSTGTAKITLSGSIGNEKRSFSHAAEFVAKSNMETDGFVEKLWATRRVGELINELDLKGHNKELIDELVHLSQKHGIITPYTSFLADETTSLAAGRDEFSARASTAVREQLSKAGGKAGFAQREFKGRLQDAAQAASAPAGPNNGLLILDAEGESREVETVRNVGQKTFFRRNGQWQDSTVTKELGKDVIHIVQFSPEYFDLAASHGGTLAKYLVFDEPTVVHLAGKTYQIDPPAEK